MKLLLLAGEDSGMIYRAQIERRVREIRPDIEIRGYGDYGFKTGDLAVMGIIQVLKRLFYFLRVKRTMERAIDEWRPDVVCTVDYPGMNLKLHLQHLYVQNNRHLQQALKQYSSRHSQHHKQNCRLHFFHPA